jgi:hypothetical protein
MSFFFFWAVLGLELWASGALQLQLQPFFVLPVFQTEFCVFDQAGLGNDLAIYASCIAGMTGVHHHAQLFIC